jgi:hypothetical protein
VHKVSQVGAEKARIELQVVILKWLGTADKLVAHLAQVRQVVPVPQVRMVVRSKGVRGPSGLAGRLTSPSLRQSRQQGRQGRQAQLVGGLGSWLPISHDFMRQNMPDWQFATKLVTPGGLAD